MPCQSTALHPTPFTPPLATPHYPPRLPLLPTHLHLSLTLSISTRRLVATATHTLSAQWHAANTISLNAIDFSDIVVSSPDDDALVYSYDAEIIDVTFSVPLDQGDNVTLVVDYLIHNPIDGLFFSAEKDGCWAVSDHETERARFWLPVVDHPSVRTTVDFDILTPKKDALTALANGRLVEKDIVQGDHHLTKWSMEQPTPSYLICIAVGKFLEVKASPHNNIPISYFAPRHSRHVYTEEDLALTFGRTNDMISFMETKLSLPLPWPKYYQFACGHIGGAMENSSLVSYDEWYMLDERSAPERSHRVDSTVVHELAHSWFGDLVVCADFCYSFLKESFATLISVEWFGHKYGDDEVQHTLTNYAMRSFAETSDYVRPIVTRLYQTSWSLFDRHLYTNGAWRLHMLRVKLGDALFWQCITQYLKTHSWKLVDAHDLRKALERHSGEQLSLFFDQWFYSKGHPILDVSFSYNSSKNSLALITVNQTQMDDNKGIGIFDLTLEIALETTPSAWQTHVLTMEAGATTAQLVIKLPSKPLQLIIDPQKKLLYQLSTVSGLADHMSLRSLHHAPTFCGRHQAAIQLHDSGSKRARAALRDAVTKEKHWGLRLFISKLLAKSMRLDALPALINAAFHEPDARVVPTILAAIGEFQHADAEAALLRFVNLAHEQMRPYGAIAAAIRGLGKQRNFEHLQLFTDHLEDVRKAGKTAEIAQAAAYSLGQLRHQEATQVLIRNIKPINPQHTPRIRCSILAGIRSAAEWETRVNRAKLFEMVEQIVLTTDTTPVRMSAAGALASLADVGNVRKAFSVLEKSIDPYSKTQLVAIRADARRAANGREGSSRETNMALEKMSTEIRKLKAKMDELQGKLDANAAVKKDSENGSAKAEEVADDEKNAVVD